MELVVLDPGKMIGLLHPPPSLEKPLHVHFLALGLFQGGQQLLEWSLLSYHLIHLL